MVRSQEPKRCDKKDRNYTDGLLLFELLLILEISQLSVRIKNGLIGLEKTHHNHFGITLRSVTVFHPKNGICMQSSNSEQIRFVHFMLIFYFFFF